MRRQYASVWNNKWASFCAKVGDSSVEPERATVAFFVASLADKLSPRTIKKYLYAIGVMCVEQGFANPMHSPLVERVCVGAKRTYGEISCGRPRRLPITTGVLATLRPFFDLAGSATDRMFWAAGCVGTYGLLRVGEFTVASARASHANVLREEHFSWDGRRQARLHLEASKTDPFRLGVDIVLAANGSATCPLAAMEAMQTDRDDDATAPLFAMPDGRPLTRSAIIGRFRAALVRAGFDASRYNGHSFRKGGAQSLALAGVPDHVIKIVGRWASDCYRLYVGVTARQFSDYAAAVGRLPASQDAPLVA